MLGLENVHETVAEIVFQSFQPSWEFWERISVATSIIEMKQRWEEKAKQCEGFRGVQSNKKFYLNNKDKTTGNYLMKVSKD